MRGANKSLMYEPLDSSEEEEVEEEKEDEEDEERFPWLQEEVLKEVWKEVEFIVFSFFCSAT